NDRNYDERSRRLHLMVITAFSASTPLVARRAMVTPGLHRRRAARIFGGANEVARGGNCFSLCVGSVAGVVRHADRSRRASTAGFPHGPPPRLHFIVLTDWKPLLRHPHLWLPEQRERVRCRIRAWSRRLLWRHRRAGRDKIAGESVSLTIKQHKEVVDPLKTVTG